MFARKQSGGAVMEGLDRSVDLGPWARPSALMQGARLERRGRGGYRGLKASLDDALMEATNMLGASQRPDRQRPDRPRGALGFGSKPSIERNEASRKIRVRMHAGYLVPISTRGSEDGLHHGVYERLV